MTEQPASPLPPVQKPMIVDLFAGPGGLDVAAHWLGVPSIGIEFDESAVATREAASLSSIFGDVRMWRPTDFTSTMNVLTGGPPCQTFTVAGNGHGRRALARVIKLVEKLGAGLVDDVLKEISTHADPRTGLVLQPLIWALRAHHAARPFEAIMLEQVPTVRPVWEAMADVLRRMGYGVDVDVLCAEQYGVPQTRRRAVLIARRDVDDKEVNLPAPTHQRYVSNGFDDPPSFEEGSDLREWVSMGETLEIGNTFYVESNYGSGGNPKNRSRRRHNRPAFTVTGKATRNKIIIADDRSLRFGATEAGRLQTFPDGYPWSGRDVSQQIGNAIPPRLGAHVLNHLLGLGIDLNEGFFAERRAAWEGPNRSEHEKVRNAIRHAEMLGESTLTVIGHPERVTSSTSGGVMGIVGGSPAVDAVEPESRHRSRTPASV